MKTLERYGILQTELKPNPVHGKVTMVGATELSVSVCDDDLKVLKLES